MKLESETQHATRVILGGEPGCAFYRNNVGVAEFVAPQGRIHHVRYGLSEGSSDLIGVVSVLITPEMVGRSVGRFVALELKAEGGKTERERRIKQQLFRALVLKLGGWAEQLDDPGQALAALARARRI
jgi:hypothetical protein